MPCLTSLKLKSKLKHFITCVSSLADYMCFLVCIEAAYALWKETKHYIGWIKKIVLGMYSLFVQGLSYGDCSIGIIRNLWRNKTFWLEDFKHTSSHEPGEKVVFGYLSVRKTLLRHENFF